ncbi:MAG: lipolytic protein family [Mucilaginibacter sp.]|nr:lipolytic protein family [Mucilaginibacter sp.]
MKKIKLLILAILFLTSSLPLFAQKQNLNIVYIGDSITQGAQLDDPNTEAPPAIASAWLRQQKDIGKVEFSNQGVSGFTTVDFLPSTNTIFARANQAAAAFNGKKETLVFSIMLGTNDSASDGPNGSPISAVQYHDNLKTIIDRLIKHFPNCRIIIQRPIWYSPNTYNGARYLQEGLTRLQSYFPQIDKLVAEYAKTRPKQVFAANRKAFDYFTEHYLTNLKPEPGRQGTFYLHPNKKGAEALGIFWAGAIYQSISKIR